MNIYVPTIIGNILVLFLGTGLFAMICFACMNAIVNLIKKRLTFLAFWKIVVLWLQLDVFKVKIEDLPNYVIADALEETYAKDLSFRMRARAVLKEWDEMDGETQA